MMLLILTSVLGYELKTAVGTSVFIMAFTAFTGAASHFAIGGMPDVTVWILCIVFTFIWARIAAVFANKASTKTLNRATGIILVVLGNCSDVIFFIVIKKITFIKSKVSVRTQKDECPIFRLLRLVCCQDSDP